MFEHCIQTREIWLCSLWKNNVNGLKLLGFDCKGFKFCFYVLNKLLKLRLLFFTNFLVYNNNRV